MKRHNSGPASVPNAPMDLTPLLDVIFIFLFVVIIKNTITVDKIDHRQQSEIEKKNDQIETLSGQNAALSEENSKLKSELRADNEFYDPYETVNRKVIFVNVHCEEISGENHNRLVVIETPDWKEEYTFNDDNRKSKYEAINNKLTDYIEKYAAEDKSKAIIISMNSENYLVRDYEKIDAIIKNLIKENENVF